MSSYLTPEEIARIQSRYLETRNKTFVARELGHSRNTVIKHTAVPSGSVDYSQELAVTPGRLIPRRIPSHTTHTLPNSFKKVCFVSCTHYPYEDAAAINAMLNYVAANNFDLFIAGGDQCDFYRISRFSKDPKRNLRVQSEIDATTGFVRNVDSLGIETVWMDGNHDHRMYLYIAEGGLSGMRALEIPSLFSLPERWTYAENQVHLKLGEVLFFHGDLSGRNVGSENVAKGMLTKLMHSCVFGHYHRFDSAHFIDASGKEYSAFASGHMCDVSKADYIRSPNWQTGFCEVDFDHANGLFEVRQHKITNGRFRANGRTWS